MQNNEATPKNRMEGINGFNNKVIDEALEFSVNSDEQDADCVSCCDEDHETDDSDSLCSPGKESELDVTSDAEHGIAHLLGVDRNRIVCLQRLHEDPSLRENRKTLHKQMFVLVTLVEMLISWSNMCFATLLYASYSSSTLCSRRH